MEGLLIVLALTANLMLGLFIAALWGVVGIVAYGVFWVIREVYRCISGLRTKP